ncbi:MAG: hypothetical protein PHC62_01075 [Candidatus Izemoplasmatales bacterium]|nr:hypothetical protein [Candidatus Izemoplasmatales bacterium]
MQNNFYNQNYVPYGNVGSMYQQQQIPVPKNTQPLTKEEIAILQRRAVEKFSTALTEEDIMIAKCTHRTHADTALVANADGSYTCSICGERIVLEDYSPEEVMEIVDKFVNLLNVTKVQFMDIPVDVVAEFFQIIPYCKRTPQLYEIAHDNYARYANYNVGMNSVNATPSNNVWNSFYGMYGGGYGQPQQMMQQPMGQPMYGQPAPVQQPQYGMGYSPTQMQQNQMVMGQNPMYAAPAPQPAQPNVQQGQPPVQNQEQTQPVFDPNQASTNVQLQL